MNNIADYTVRKRYLACQRASDKQNKMIKKLYDYLGMHERAEHDYNHLNYYQASSLIRLLKNKTKKKRRS